MPQGSDRRELRRMNVLKWIYARLPHQGSRSVELDFVRGVAILMVMGNHFMTVPTNNLLYRFLQYPGQQIGGRGVDLFFVLSGFLVGGLLIKEYKTSISLDARRFIFRRGMKIWPAYYVYIFLVAVTHWHPLSSFLWQNLLHVQNYAGSSLSQTWSLAIEEHFYLALAVSMAWMVRRKWTPHRMMKWFLVLMGVELIIRTICYLTLGKHSAMMHTQCRLDSLVCGVVLALLFYFFPEKFLALSRRWILLSIITVAVVIYLFLNNSILIESTIGYTIIYVGAGAFLLLVYSHSGSIRNWIAYRAVAAIGVYSYGIYLYHASIRGTCLHLALRFPSTLQWPVVMVTQYASAILLGVVMTRIVEWPFLRYRDRIIPQRVADIGSPKVAAAEAAGVPVEVET